MGGVQRPVFFFKASWTSINTCESFKMIGRIFFIIISFFVASLHANFGQKVLNVRKFVNMKFQVNCKKNEIHIRKCYTKLLYQIFKNLGFRNEILKNLFLENGHKAQNFLKF